MPAEVYKWQTSLETSLLTLRERNTLNLNEDSLWVKRQVCHMSSRVYAHAQCLRSADSHQQRRWRSVGPTAHGSPVRRASTPARG